MDENDSEIFEDDGSLPPVHHAPIPKWLIWSYILLPVWGIVTLVLYWNGSWGWFDRGYWHELQEAAGTTFEVSEKIP